MKNLRLSLYAFHLYQTLDDPPDTVNQDAANLWESLTNLAQFLPFPELQTLKSQLISYSSNQEGNYQYSLQGEDKLFNCPLFRFEAQNLTLLVSLAKPKQADLERANRDYSWFRDLLWSYQKITFAYQEARACYKSSRLIYGSL